MFANMKLRTRSLPAFISTENVHVAMVRAHCNVGTMPSIVYNNVLLLHLQSSRLHPAVSRTAVRRGDDCS